jgi:hypothetical protein
MTQEPSTRLKGLIRWVARNLQYHPVTELIDQPLTLSSLDRIVNDSQELIRRFFPGGTYRGPEEKYRVGVLAKYGLLDLTFAVPEADFPPKDVPGCTPLRSLGFVGTRKSSANPEDPNELLIWLEQMEEEIKNDGAIVKLMLVETKHLAPERETWRKWVREPGLMPFPKDFRVLDACLTNSDSVWINKHFYL